MREQAKAMDDTIAASTAPTVPSVSFQYFSDVHISHMRDYSITKMEQRIIPRAPYLIIAGDIGPVVGSTPIYFEFLRMLSSKFEKVFITSGNHEYYNTSGIRIGDVNSIICANLPSNVFFLQEDFHMITPKLVILGTTLWSRILDTESAHISASVADYTFIPHFSTGVCRMLYESNVWWLRDVLENSHADTRFVVVTHHLPSFGLISPEFDGCGVNSAFASNVDANLGEVAKHKIVAWVAGHTHRPIESGIYHVNPIGYPGENAVTNYQKVFTVPAPQ